MTNLRQEDRDWLLGELPERLREMHAGLYLLQEAAHALNLNNIAPISPAIHQFAMAADGLRERIEAMARGTKTAAEV